MLTTAQAAALLGLPKEQFRSAMSKERKNGKEFHAPRDKWLDGRTPLWDEKKILAWAKDRKKRKKRKKDADAEAAVVMAPKSSAKASGKATGKSK